MVNQIKNKNKDEKKDKASELKAIHVDLNSFSVDGHSWNGRPMVDMFGE